MWIVRLALRRPYTFVVAALLAVILWIVIVFVQRMPTDIFPDVDIPVISVIFNYGGMSPDDMEKRIVGGFERFLSTTVNDIEHIESQSLYGIAVVKVYFQKGAKIEAATAQITAVSQTAIRSMPPGSVPPLIIRYSASNVPILQMAFSSDTLPEQRVSDLAMNTIRPQLVTIPGVQIPGPYGGKPRQIMVDLDPEKLFAWGLSASDVSAAISAQNLILPAGTVKIGKQEYQVRLNASPDVAADLNDVPIKTIRGTTVTIKDVAQVRDGFSVQTSVVHVNGKRGVLLSFLKSGGASTLDIVSNIRAAMPRIRAQAPAELKIDLLFDQSLFVRAAVEDVVKEGLIAAGLTGLMILLFLGSWRSTIIVMVSIPLSIMVSIIILATLGHTLNVMTLGGLALAVGILVDDATVEIENIHRNLHQRKRLVKAILDGASQIAVPAFVSTLCICIVFVPVVFISGSAKYLFTPLAMAVVFAMLTSYLLSRTLVPTMVHYLLAAEVEMYGGQLDATDPHAAKALHRREELQHGPPRVQGLRRRGVRLALLLVAVALGALTWAVRWGIQHAQPAWLTEAWAWLSAWVRDDPRSLAFWACAIVATGLALYLIARLKLIWRLHNAFDRQFEKFRRFYGGLLDWALDHRLAVLLAFIALVGVSCALFPLIGRDFFPTVDAGQIRLHIRTPAGTRIEETERYFARAEQIIHRVIPQRNIATLLDNAGIPNSGINLSLGEGTLVAPSEGEFLIALEGAHRPTPQYVRELRRRLAREMPELVCFFQSPDIATQVLNFGIAAPIDIQVSGPQSNVSDNETLARQMIGDLRRIPGAVDLRLQQVARAPNLLINVDRTLADQMGLSQADVASELLVSLSSSGMVSPNFWLDRRSGISYSVMVQTPQYRINSPQTLESTPILPAGARTAAGSLNAQLLGNLASLEHGTTPVNITHYTINPAIDIHVGVQGTDLARVARGVQEVVDRYTPKLPRGSTVTVRGQVQSMNDSFTGLALGLIFAVILVYLLMVINFQSWMDPLIILMALPGALSGILWMLFATGTNISVPALMGAIMSIGVATANSILMITFANDQRELGVDARGAALAAGFTRLRPVMMTALAMIIGMLPMSLGLGEGGEQNAPLGRAVIGGLVMATFATLFFVPVVYSALRRKPPQTQTEEELQ